MDDKQIRLKCLELGMSGQPHLTVQAAKVYYDFVVGGGAPTEPQPRRRGRPPKSAAPE